MESLKNILEIMKQETGKIEVKELIDKIEGSMGLHQLIQHLSKVESELTKNGFTSVSVEIEPYNYGDDAHMIIRGARWETDEEYEYRLKKLLINILGKEVGWD